MLNRECYKRGTGYILHLRVLSEQVRRTQSNILSGPVAFALFVPPPQLYTVWQQDIIVTISRTAVLTQGDRFFNNHDLHAPPTARGSYSASATYLNARHEDGACEPGQPPAQRCVLIHIISCCARMHHCIGVSVPCKTLSISVPASPKQPRNVRNNTLSKRICIGGMSTGGMMAMLWLREELKEGLCSLPCFMSGSTVRHIVAAPPFFQPAGHRKVPIDEIR